mmetsp:Transcript_37154/g.58730  ORF Transcript_37154/g.58730 Transcript_37154/m.58730 type:complete len:303 (-) Transcript_37154:1351-2259(-)
MEDFSALVRLCLEFFLQRKGMLGISSQSLHCLHIGWVQIRRLPNLDATRDTVIPFAEVQGIVQAQLLNKFAETTGMDALHRLAYPPHSTETSVPHHEAVDAPVLTSELGNQQLHEEENHDQSKTACDEQDQNAVLQSNEAACRVHTHSQLEETHHGPNDVIEILWILTGSRHTATETQDEKRTGETRHDKLWQNMTSKQHPRRQPRGNCCHVDDEGKLQQDGHHGQDLVRLLQTLRLVTVLCQASSITLQTVDDWLHVKHHYQKHCQDQTDAFLPVFHPLPWYSNATNGCEVPFLDCLIDMS